jgi:nucleoside-diphosphate-sugar epimerase
MPHAVVAGGVGFIGSHLCAALLDHQWSVTAFDNLSTGSRSNLLTLVERPDFEFIQADVTRPLDSVRRADAVFHLASPASVPAYLSRPLQTLDVNSVGTRMLLDLARRDDARFLFASTSEVYGDPLVHPQTESYWGNVNPTGPRSPYDEGKRFGEALVLAHARVHSTDVRIARIFNTYGPLSSPNDGRLVPNFITQALRGEPLTIYGDGRQTRSFCFVEDLVAGLVSATLERGTTGEVFNLGNPQEYTVLQLAHIVASMTGLDAGISHRPLPIDDPARRCPDISKARRILSWEPETSLEKGLELTIQWFRDFMKIPHATAPAG